MIHYLTHQELFDNALIGMRYQGGPSCSLTSGMGMMRNDDGRKCSIGWSIPDEDYDAYMDVHPEDVPECSLPLSLLPDYLCADNEFRADLIRIHDAAMQEVHYTDMVRHDPALADMMFMFVFEMKMAAFATKHYLAYSPAQEERATYTRVGA